MAQVGDVVVALKATTAGFSGPLKQAQQELARTSQQMRGVAASAKQVDGATAIANQRFREAFGASTQAATGLRVLEQDLRLAKADFAAGLISADDYAAALAHVRAEAVAMRVAGGVTGAELGTFNRLMGQTAPTAARARQGLGTIRSSLASLTTTMVGARGTLGTLLGGLTQFAVGNAVAIGIIAGIAAIAAGYRALTSRAREAAEATKRLGEDARRAFLNQPDIQRRDNQLALDASIARARGIREQIDTFRALDARGSPGAAATVERLTRRLREQNQTTIALRRQQQELAEDTKNAAINMGELADEMRRATQASGGLEAAFRSLATKDLGLVSGPGTPIDFHGDAARGRVLGALAQVREQQAELVDAVREAGRRGAKAFADEFGAQDERMDRAGQQVGESIIRGLVRSLTDRRLDIGRLFVNTIAALLEDALISAIRNAMNKRKGSLFGDVLNIASMVASFIPGGGVAAKVLSGGKDFSGVMSAAAAPVGGVSLNVTVAAPSNPLAAARDAEWQRALKESLDVARATGYRFA